jgi:hypothetical protein
VIRVSTITGDLPIILVVPRGVEDKELGTIAHNIAKNLKVNAVINQGFEVADYVNSCKDLADCNRVDHLVQPVVYDEFLKPLIKFKNRTIQPFIGLHRRRHNSLTIFYLLGTSNRVHTQANEAVSMILGYGRGKKVDSFTCRPWRKNLIIDLWRKFVTDGGEVYEGKGDGKYSGRNSNCVNQYFRKHRRDLRVNSMEVHLPESTRNENSLGFVLTKVLKHYLGHDGYDTDPYTKFI